MLGPGLGFVDVFTPDGTLVQRFAGFGLLDAPWGIAMAPATGFGQFSGDLLVGNFGDGHITAFRMSSHLPFAVPAGQLRAPDGRRVSIDGLWALQFGNGASAGPTTSLFFTAGPDNQANGLFGTLTPATATPGGGDQDNQ